MKNGFTLIELSIVLGILATLIGLITLNLLSATTKASINTTATALITDLKQQQLLAMKGNRPIGATSDNFGVYFATDRYTLFFGSLYNPSNPTNFVIALPDNITFSTIALPSNTIIFAKGNGEIVGYDPTQNKVTLTDTNALPLQKTIEFNRRGVVTNVY
ncbi:MAG: prepilin-type N-terminal cleavage/methylation domain-containing protein [Candidatus Levybacteria bacterium]|nr:prepilin-type N-terminal cleavage/methylation domain-containing protein [Candidatus Levybacteria bacterium]